MKKLIALTAAAATIAGLAGTVSAATTKTVKVTDDKFVKDLVVIHRGDSVKWVWTGRHKHQVFQTGGPGHFHSKAGIRKGGTFRHRFRKTGTYKFICSYQSGMTMTVKVIR